MFKQKSASPFNEIHQETLYNPLEMATEWLKLGNAHLKKCSCQCYTNLWRCQWNSLARKCHPKAPPASSGGTAYAFHLLPGIVYYEHQANNCSFLVQILYENVVTVECVCTSGPLGSFQLLSLSPLSLHTSGPVRWEYDPLLSSFLSSLCIYHFLCLYSLLVFAVLLSMNSLCDVLIFLSRVCYTTP